MSLGAGVRLGPYEVVAPIGAGGMGEVYRATASADGAKLALTKGRTVRNVLSAPLLKDRPVNWADVVPLTSDEADYETIDVSRDGRIVVASDRSGTWDIWALSEASRQERRLTSLSGRRGRIGSNGLATDGRYVYFLWEESRADIWVADIVLRSRFTAPPPRPRSRQFSPVPGRLMPDGSILAS